MWQLDSPFATYFNLEKKIKSVSTESSVMALEDVGLSRDESVMLLELASEKFRLIASMYPLRSWRELRKRRG